MTQLAGFYINLDRAPDRDAFMQEQLARLGMQWVQRHRAVDGALGAELLAAFKAIMENPLSALI